MSSRAKPVAGSRTAFTMIELLLALGMVVVLSSAFHASIGKVDEYMQRLALRSDAAAVLDNTIARIAATPERTLDALTVVFSDEFGKSSLSVNDRGRAVWRIDDGGLHLEIADPAGRLLGDVVFPLQAN